VRASARDQSYCESDRRAQNATQLFAVTELNGNLWIYIYVCEVIDLLRAQPSSA
jgi:hypothetical protein